MGLCGWYVVRVFVRVFQLLPIGFNHNKKLCCVTESTKEHLQKPYWKSDLPWFSYDYRKFMFVDFLIGYTGRSVVFTVECGVVIDG